MRGAPVRLPLALVGSQGPGRIILGHDIGRTPRLMVHHRSEPTLPHLFVSGGTGGGKGSVLRCYEVHALHHHHPLIVIERGGMGENAWMDGAASRVKTLAGARAAYAYARAEMKRRGEHMDAEGVANAGELGYLPLTIVADEFPNVGGNEAADTEAEAELVDDLLTDVADLARNGRKHLVFLVIVSQRPTFEATFARAGGAIAGNMAARIHLGDRDAEALKAAFRGSSGVKASILACLEAVEVPGRCLYNRLNPKDGKHVQAGQLWLITAEQAATFAARYEGPEPMQFDPRPARTFAPQPMEATR